MITLTQYWMGRDKTYADQWSDEIQRNAVELLHRVNGLLADVASLEKHLDIEALTVSSGWRPAAVNAATANSAKHSLHMAGKAVDIADPSHVLYMAIIRNYPLLAKWELWMENAASTGTWCHLDMGIRTDRNIRTFLP